jgi:hypothetical protein
VGSDRQVKLRIDNLSLSFGSMGSTAGATFGVVSLKLLDELVTVAGLALATTFPAVATLGSCLTQPHRACIGNYPLPYVYYISPGGWFTGGSASRHITGYGRSRIKIQSK